MHGQNHIRFLALYFLFAFHTQKCIEECVFSITFGHLRVFFRTE